MRTAIILAAALIADPTGWKGWVMFVVSLTICVVCDALQTEWLRLNNKNKENDE